MQERDRCRPVGKGFLKVQQQKKSEAVSERHSGVPERVLLSYPILMQDSYNREPILQGYWGNGERVGICRLLKDEGEHGDSVYCD